MTEEMKSAAPERRIHPLRLISLVAVFGIGYAVSHLSDLAYHADQGVTDEVRTVRGYKYTNPLLECEGSADLFKGEFRPSTRELRALLDEYEARGDISEAAVYWRDLNNGPWFGLQEKEPFAASSMLKVAQAMAYYKTLEKTPALLEGRMFTYSHVFHTDSQTIQPEEKLVLGQKYTGQELVRRMIVYSDNEALYLLEDQIPEATSENVFADLNMEFTTDNEISIRSYSTLFRVLYNASYLSYEHSEELLAMLTQTTFDEGLRAGVPISVPVAHKFGERALQNPLNQLHDCGIVYYPDHPYLLCVMTRGNSMPKLAATIREVSRFVYAQIQSHYGE